MPGCYLGHDGVAAGRVPVLHVVPGVHHRPVELADTKTAELEVWGERLRREEDVRVPPVGKEGAASEGLPLVSDPPLEIFECETLPSLVDLVFLLLPLYTELGRAGDAGEDCELCRMG